MGAKRTDANQAEIVQALRAIGATVQDLSQLGKGCPDLLCGYGDRNYLIEVKNSEDRVPRLTHCEEEWIRGWKGQVAVITTVEEAIAVIRDKELDATGAQNTVEGRGANNVLVWGS